MISKGHFGSRGVDELEGKSGGCGKNQELLRRASTKGVTMGKKKNYEEKDKRPNTKVSKGCKYSVQSINT